VLLTRRSSVKNVTKAGNLGFFKLLTIEGLAKNYVKLLHWVLPRKCNTILFENCKLTVKFPEGQENLTF
jgi:hypothetical protein